MDPNHFSNKFVFSFFQFCTASKNSSIASIGVDSENVVIHDPEEFESEFLRKVGFKSGTRKFLE